MIDWIVTGFTALLLFASANGFADGGQSSYLIAGFLGGLVRAFLAKSGTLTERIIGGFTGAVSSYYLTPIFALALGIPDPQILSGVAFIVGLISMYLAEAIITIAKAYARDPGALKDAVKDILLRLIAPKK
ncbi:hypothetical protein [Shinella sp.]|uniref:hypothetical protein n=1 Tax=Shinella sp. TaxID=1870904 RepID=UPI0040362AA7